MNSLVEQKTDINGHLSRVRKFYKKWFKGKFTGSRSYGNPAQRLISPRQIDEMIQTIKRTNGQCPQYMSVNYKILYDGKIIVEKIEKLFLDFDSPNDLKTAYRDVINAYNIVKSLGAKPLIVFSGSKGYHLYVWLPDPLKMRDFKVFTYPTFLVKAEIWVKTLYNILFEKYFDTLDKVVLEPQRISRIPYTIHQKTRNIVAVLDPETGEKVDVEKGIELLEYSVNNPLPKEVLDEVWLDYSFKIVRPRGFRKRKYTTNRMPFLLKYVFDNGVGIGARNNAAFALALFFKLRGRSKSEVYNILFEWNMKNRPPLPEREIQSVVKSVYTHHYKYFLSKEKLEREWLDGVL